MEHREACRLLSLEHAVSSPPRRASTSAARATAASTTSTATNKTSTSTTTTTAAATTTTNKKTKQTATPARAPRKAKDHSASPPKPSRPTPEKPSQREDGGGPEGFPPPSPATDSHPSPFRRVMIPRLSAPAMASASASATPTSEGSREGNAMEGGEATEGLGAESRSEAPAVIGFANVEVDVAVRNSVMLLGEGDGGGEGGADRGSDTDEGGEDSDQFHAWPVRNSLPCLTLVLAA